MELNAELFDFYSSHLMEFEAVSRWSTEHQKFNGPYLCSPGKEYCDSKLKIVIVGQETNGWTSHTDVSKQMQTYSDFSLGKKYFSSPFWNVIRKIEKELNGEHYCCASLNLNKFDINGKPPREPFLTTIEKLDHILYDEIQLLKPDVVIFFTGPKYDRRISKLFNNELTEIDGFHKRKLAEMTLADKPFKIFRTYHPNYLRRTGLENQVIHQMVTSVNS
jgi:hypothetical protein